MTSACAGRLFDTRDRPPGGEFVFVGGLADAVDQAKAAAAGKQVNVMGGADAVYLRYRTASA